MVAASSHHHGAGALPWWWWAGSTVPGGRKRSTSALSRYVACLKRHVVDVGAAVVATVAAGSRARLAVAAAAEQLHLVGPHVERGPGLTLLILVLAGFEVARDVDLLPLRQGPLLGQGVEDLAELAQAVTLNQFVRSCGCPPWSVHFRVTAIENETFNAPLGV